MVQDDSHSTLRASADNNSRRADSIGMGKRSGLEDQIWPNSSGPEVPINLKFTLHTRQYWDKIPLLVPSDRVHSNACPRRHRPQNPQPAAIRQPHDHAGARRQGWPFRVALSPPGEIAGRARRDHPLHRDRRPEIARAACQRLHLDQAGAAEGGRPHPFCQGDFEMGRGAGMLFDDRQPRLSPARRRRRSVVLRGVPEEQTDPARRHRLDRVELCPEPGEIFDRAAGVRWVARYWMLSSSAQAEDPVCRGFSTQSLMSLEYWVPAFAGTTLDTASRS